MSRKQVDNSAAVSLFPFLAVLLCTMGALLVVLVAVSRSARNAALHQALARRDVAPAEQYEAAREKMKQITDYVGRLKQVRDDAESKLRADQLRIGQVENHMRRLQDELQKVVYANMELDALEGDHYDDLKQAERERDRLRRLIAEKEALIDELKDGANKRKRTYSLVPYEGPNGTLRRPLIVECTKDGLVLQPEGILIKPQDLQPPLGSGNALASALRAARDHYIQQNPAEGRTRDTEPYPMLVIRPEGTQLFGLARRAIEAADFDFGYEPVESHWELNYGIPDPVLARIEQQALEQARARQEMLAAAAPRAYRNPDLSAAGRFEYDDDPSTSFGGNRGNGSTSATRPTIVLPTRGPVQSGSGAPTGASDASVRAGVTSENGRSTSAEQTASQPGNGGPDRAGANPESADNQPHGSDGGGGPNQLTDAPQPAQSGARVSAGAAGGAASGGTPGMQESDQPAAASARQSSTIGSANDIDINHPQTLDPNQEIAPKWSAPRKNTRAVPVRRTIRAVVREEHVGLISDESRMPPSDLSGKTIPFEGDTVESMDEFVKAVQSQVESWGIAGDNLYWRPVLEIQVGPGGQRRAEDLARLLKNSDIEVQLPSTATNIAPGDSRATR